MGLEFKKTVFSLLSVSLNALQHLLCTCSSIVMHCMQCHASQDTKRFSALIWGSAFFFFSLKLPNASETRCWEPFWWPLSLFAAFDCMFCTSQRRVMSRLLVLVVIRRKAAWFMTFFTVWFLAHSTMNILLHPPRHRNSHRPALSSSG